MAFNPTIEVPSYKVAGFARNINPPSCDPFSRHGAYNFEAGDLICKKVSLNLKSWSPNGDQAKTFTWRDEH